MQFLCGGVNVLLYISDNELPGVTENINLWQSNVGVTVIPCFLVKVCYCDCDRVILWQYGVIITAQHTPSLSENDVEK